MFASKSFLILGLFCVGSVISKRVVCDFEDSACLTKTAGLTFEEFIDGIPGVKTSEPLEVKDIDVKLDNLHYKLIDAKLIGMRKCKVELVKISAKDLKYDYHVGCPHLTIKAGYEIKGELGPHHVDGKGDCDFELYDYHFLYHGDYTTKQDKEGKTHIYLKTHTLTLRVDGKVVYDLRNLFAGDKEKTESVLKWVNDNYVAVHNGTAQQTMDAFMGVPGYLGNVNDHLDRVAADILFSFEE